MFRRIITFSVEQKPIIAFFVLVLIGFGIYSMKQIPIDAVPLSAVGGIAALWLRGIPFSISADVGFIALFGVAVLNGIVLMSYYRQMEQEGITNVKYIVIKGAYTRLRPVLITASTDILGFLPMAISVSAGAEVQRPLATVVIGGIITSTMLTLIILPIIYLMMNSKDGISFRPLRKRKPSPAITMTLALLLLLSPGLLYSQDTIPESLSLQQAVDSALLNNIQIDNACLRIDQAKSQKTGAWNFTPTELNYQQGQINSENQDMYLEVNQNFGSILSHIQALKKAKINQEAQTAAYHLAVKQLIAEVKSAYVFWQYNYANSVLLENEKELYQKLADIATLRYNSGDIDLLKKSITTSKVSEITAQFLNSLDHLVIAENKLKQMMMIDGHFVPESSEPRLYMVAKKTDTSSYSANVHLNYLSKKYKLVKADEAIVKSNYFPELKAGFFTQNINELNHLYGWQIGVAFPLWLPKQQADIKQSKIESEIALNTLEYQKIQLYYEIENLLFILNKNFRQIRYYQENALPQAELLIKTATAQLNTEEIDYTEFLQSISMAIDIKQAYYLTIHDYNQTAIQLEIYGD